MPNKKFFIKEDISLAKTMPSEFYLDKNYFNMSLEKIFKASWDNPPNDRQMKIFVAKDAGYCFGVRDAVNMAYDASDKFGEVYMLGDIVHNENVIDDLSNAGATKVKKLDDIPKNKPILFRAHGTVNDLWEEAKSKNMNILDATCPLVHEIHHEVRRLYKENRQIIVIGDHGHDEVKAIANQVPNTIVIANSEEAKKIKKFNSASDTQHPLNPYTKAYGATRKSWAYSHHRR